ncbi:MULTISPECIES: ATP-binding protein [Streptomyces]|uniref:ATP-binding protein n=1 Tax=Streptomyces lonegramiae TaxID=3075524 RepID=A0ABU2XVU5_9ACTN|nr:ATP-binding protein [Streptomyces sp. DSM 41529]MDT0550040.1 ATP-binding protein [Streptomyces sp. DSM 41529]
MISLATRRFFRAEFPARTDRAFAVRRMLTAFLKYWKLDQAVDSAVLATNELFANAVEHGSSGPDDTVTVTVGVEPAGDELRIEVADGSPVPPVFRAAAETEECGRGLAIVDGLASAWGTDPPDGDGAGKKVWFTLALDRAR